MTTYYDTDVPMQERYSRTELHDLRRALHERDEEHTDEANDAIAAFIEWCFDEERNA